MAARWCTVSEQWKPIAGYEGLYEISDHGRARSLSRVDRLGRIRPGNMLTPTGLRHLHVTLSKDGRKQQPAVHRLVADAFIPNPDGLPIVLHWDDNPANNHHSNLRWGSSGSNRADAVRNGIRTGGSLAEEDVREIRNRLASGESQRAIAARFGVHSSNISLISSGRIWAHV